jgi:hypothetical protein
LEGAAALGGELGHVVALGAASYPLSGSSPELDRWLERNGRTPSWYEALGHDAATLAAAVLEALPAVALTERSQVSAHYDAVRKKLRLEQVPLWTASTATFDTSLTLQRAFTLQGGPSRPAQSTRP